MSVVCSTYMGYGIPIHEDVADEIIARLDEELIEGSESFCDKYSWLIDGYNEDSDYFLGFTTYLGSSNDYVIGVGNLDIDYTVDDFNELISSFGLTNIIKEIKDYYTEPFKAIINSWW